MILLGVPSWIIRPFSNNKNNSTWNKCCHNLKIMLWNFSWQRKHQPYYKQHINELAITGSVNKVIVMCSAWYKVIKRDMQTANLTMYVKEILWVTRHTTWLVKKTNMYSAQVQKQKLTSHIKIESCYNCFARKHNANISVKLESPSLILTFMAINNALELHFVRSFGVILPTSSASPYWIFLFSLFSKSGKV